MCACAEWADKPGSVVGRPFIFCLRCRRPHSRATRTRAGPTHGVPICPFSGWGLPSRAVADTLVRSYRTVSAFLASAMAVTGVFFSVALSVGSPRPAVSRHPALWSPDFPHRDAEAPPARPSGPLRNGAVYTKARRVHPAPRLSPRLHTTPPAPLGLLGLVGAGGSCQYMCLPGTSYSSGSLATLAMYSVYCSRQSFHCE